jgi:hypothetical protein
MKRTLAVLVTAALSSMAAAQTTTPPDSTTPPPPPSTTPPATEPTAPNISAQYLTRTQTRYGSLTESSDDMTSLVTGLRTGGEITLGGETFTSPTKPMGYGNITRTLDLARKQLAAQGITQPTSAELRTSLTEILDLRAQGMGWGKIAQTVGVHPGMGKASVTTAVPAPSSGGTQSGLTTAGGGKGIVTAAGGRSSFARAHGNGRAFNASSASTAGSSAGGAVSAVGKGNATPNGKALGRIK